MPSVSFLNAAAKALTKRLGFVVTVRRVGRGRIATDPYEAQRRLIARLGIARPLIFDVGAHYGETIKRYKRALPDCRMVSFEPTPESFERLTRDWGADSDVTLVNKAVTATDGLVEFHVNAFDATNSTLPRPSRGRRYYPKFAGMETKITVQGTTLDSYLGAGECPDILKMDIQGGELAALKGADRLLKLPALKLIYTEALFIPHYENQPLFHDISAYLAQRGYSLYNIYNPQVATNGQLRYGDALFVSADVRQRCLDALPEEP